MLCVCLCMLVQVQIQFWKHSYVLHMYNYPKDVYKNVFLLMEIKNYYDN